MMELKQTEFPALNLPKADLRLSGVQGQIRVYDTIRKKELLLTPEEWVRQHLIHYLVVYRNYPKSLFVVERGLVYNHLPKRLDIMVLDRTGQPYMLIECKAPDVALSVKTLEQVCVYNQQIGAPYIVVSNGLKHIVLGIAEGKQYLPLPDFPEFNN